MRLLLPLAALALLCGCSIHYVGGLSTGGTVAPVPPIAPIPPVVGAPPGLSASITVSGGLANVLYWMTGAGIYAAMLMDEAGHGGPFLAPMRADRTVVEVDCTRPIPPEAIGNIRCK